MINFIDIHTHRLNRDENTFSVMNIRLPDNEIPEKIYVSAGWHPWDIEPFPLFQIKTSLENAASRENVLALGECGLDRSVNIPFEKQVEVFKIHLSLAKKLEKPLIVHCVKAYSDLLEILKKEKFNGKIVLHNFNGNRPQIDSFLKTDTFFSLGKQIENQNSKAYKSIAYFPPEKIFLETDDAEISIQETYLFASKLLNIPVEKLKSQIKQNFTMLFGEGLISQIGVG
jgi:TatD DNase family protein